VWYVQAPEWETQFSAHWLSESRSGREMLLRMTVGVVTTLAGISLSRILKRPQIIADGNNGE
jgi:hypothetical protein